nr:reverse transcriptase domain-containing protein [Tanacetum cinerariifolium]
GNFFWQWEHITGSGKTALEVGMDQTFNSQQTVSMAFTHREMLQNYHGHNLSKGNIIKIFNHGLSEVTQEVLNVTAGGIFLYKTPNQASQLLEDKVLPKLDRAKNQKTKPSLKKTVAFVDEAEIMLREVGKFTFPVDFVILEMEEDSKVPLILGQPFLHIADAVIRVQQKQLNLRIGTKRINFNIDSAMKHSHSNDDTYFSIDAIDEILEEDFDALLDEGSKILQSIELTYLEIEIFTEFDEFIAMTADENSNYLLDDKKPVILKQRRLNPNMQEVVKKEIIKLLDTGIIYPIADSPWVSPIHCVPKKGGTTVVTNENDELVPKRTVTGYFQIPIDPTDQEKTTFTCPFSTYAYRRMPFGLCNTPATFQRYMLEIFLDMIEESVKLFMDDFLSFKKCHFMVKEGIVLGHKVSSIGLEVDKAKINVFSKLSPPANIKDIRSFLGHVGFYRRFIKDFLKIARPLTKLLEKYTPFEFNDECQKAFELLKEKLTCAPVIVRPNWNLPFKLMCDANDFAVGAVLGQKDEFDNEIKDRKGTKNVAADHLSRIENDELSDDSQVDDNFLRETLMEINTKYEPSRLLGPYVVKHQYPSGYVELYGKMERRS